MIFLHDGLPLIAYLIPYFSLILLSTLEQVCIHNSFFFHYNLNFPPMTWAKKQSVTNMQDVIIVLLKVKERKNYGIKIKELLL